MNTLESVTINSPINADEECAQFTIDTPSDAFTLSDICQIGEKYTLSYWIKSDAQGSFTAAGKTVTTTTEWAKYDTTFTAAGVDLPWIFGITGTYYIYHPQLEIGTISTDWTPSPDDVTDAIENSETRTHEVISERETSILATTASMILSASETLVKTGDYETFKQSVEAQLSIMGDEIAMNFTNTVEHITEVDGDLQEFLTAFQKYIKFSGETAITIGSGDSAVTLEIDNVTGLVFKRNDEEFGKWDGQYFYTGSIVVEVNQRIKIGGFVIQPRSSGDTMILWVGEEG